MMSKFTACLLACVFVLVCPVSVAAAVPDDEEFLVVEKVYAFTSPVETKAQIDALLEKDYQVVLGIMPVYEHTDYPAMQEFAEVIRYAQAKGCRILLHFPIVQKSSATTEEIESLLETQYALYEGMEIYPQGILLGPDDATYAWMAGELDGSFSVFELEDPALECYVDTLGESFPVLKTDKLPEQFYSYEAHEIPENFDFKRGLVENISVSLEQENQVLMVIVVVGIVIFSGMIVYARKRNKRDFLKKEDDGK